MSLLHAASGDVVSLQPLGDGLASAKSTAIVRTPHLELIRTVLHAGRSIPEHKIDGELTLQCIEGELCVSAQGRKITLAPGQMLFLGGGVPHAVEAVKDSSALLTLLRVKAE
jgi:quercetin dioxygenase-like cupin family protein